MGGNIFMRATALESIGGYNTKIVFYGDDIDTINRMATVGKVMYRNAIAVPSSARRFQRQGVMKVQLRYILNYIWVVLFHRPFSNVSGG
jgi:GT2 family glycosyltransferase